MSSSGHTTDPTYLVYIFSTALPPKRSCTLGVSGFRDESKVFFYLIFQDFKSWKLSKEYKSSSPRLTPDSMSDGIFRALRNYDGFIICTIFSILLTEALSLSGDVSQSKYAQIWKLMSGRRLHDPQPHHQLGQKRCAQQAAKGETSPAVLVDLHVCRRISAISSVPKEALDHLKATPEPPLVVPI